MESSPSDSNIERTEDWRFYSFWKKSQFIFVCFVGISIIAVPMLFLFVVVSNPTTTTKQKSIKTDVVKGWEPHVNRDLRHYVLPNNKTTLLQPHWNCGNHTPYLLIIVNSALYNTRKRLAIRDTWGSVHGVSNVTVYLAFLIGTSREYSNRDPIQKKLFSEFIRYRDIIQEPFRDTYNNLTLKSVFLLKWVLTNCPGARFIMKADDDLFVNVHSLLLSLLQMERKRALMCAKKTVMTNQSHTVEPLLLGHLTIKQIPQSHAKSKWFAPKYMYQSKTYPNYLSGGAGYVMSADTVAPLYTAALRKPLFYLEDVFVTGICAQEARIIPRDNPGFSYDVKLDPCVLRNTSVVTANIKNEKYLRKIWVVMKDPSLKCA